MGNPWTGEVALAIDGEQRVLKLTLGALAQLEDELHAGTLIELIERFEGGQVSARDVMALIVAGLRGGGWQGSASDLMASEIEGGPVHATQAAGELLRRAFSLPGS